METATKSPIEKPDGKEWFAEGYEPPKQAAPNVIYRCFGPPLPARTDTSDSGLHETESPSAP